MNTNAILRTSATILVDIILSVNMVLWNRRVNTVWKIFIIWDIQVIRDMLRNIEIMRITVKMAHASNVCVNIIKLLENIEHHWVKYNVTYNNAHLLYGRLAILVTSELEVVKHDRAEYLHQWSYYIQA